MSDKGEIISPGAGGGVSRAPSLPHRGLHSPAKSRGFRIRLMIRSRVVEKTSSNRSRSASSELHIARARDTRPTG